MKKLTTLMLVLFVAITFVACSDDDNPVDSGGITPPAGPVVTSYDGTNYTTEADASSTDNFTGMDFAAEMTNASTKSGSPIGTANDWDIAFRREVIKLNGGASSEGRDNEAMDLGAVEYANVTAADTVGKDWVSDAVDHFIDEWYDYNFQTHEITMNQYVYSMVDAEGDNYCKFRVDSIVGGGMPPAMGTVWITYYYNPTADSKDLSGNTMTASILVDAAHGYTGYFDFSVGTQVTPASPSTSTDWDISFANYEIATNSGPNGPGDCAAFPAHGEMQDPTNIDGFMMQPNGAPMFPDIPSSAMTEWYTYDGQTHTLNSNAHVYIVKTATGLYKMQILSYYKNIQGIRTSGYYTVKWDEL